MNGAEFKEIREYLGLSVSEVARIVGVNKRTVRRWEADNPPPHPSAAKILQWMDDGILWPPEAPQES